MPVGLDRRDCELKLGMGKALEKSGVFVWQVAQKRKALTQRHGVTEKIAAAEVWPVVRLIIYYTGAQDVMQRGGFCSAPETACEEGSADMRQRSRAR